MKLTKAVLYCYSVEFSFYKGKVEEPIRWDGKTLRPLTNAELGDLLETAETRAHYAAYQNIQKSCADNGLPVRTFEDSFAQTIARHKMLAKAVRAGEADIKLTEEKVWI